MKQAMRNDLKAIENELGPTTNGIFSREEARAALERVKQALELGSFERTQREYLAADLKALAEGKPVVTDLAKAVDNRIQMLKLETAAATSMLLDVQQESIASAKRVCELERWAQELIAKLDEPGGL